MAKKCQLCDEPAVQPFDGKWHCWKHYCEVKRKSNKKNYIIQLIKKTNPVWGNCNWDSGRNNYHHLESFLIFRITFLRDQFSINYCNFCKYMPKKRTGPKEPTLHKDKVEKHTGNTQDWVNFRCNF